MVMPMSSSRDSSLFRTYDFNLSSYQEQCLRDFGVKPRPTWITTEFGGHVREQPFMHLSLQICFPFLSISFRMFMDYDTVITFFILYFLLVQKRNLNDRCRTTLGICEMAFLFCK